MKTNKNILAAATVLLAVACSKSVQEPSVNTSKTITIEASIEGSKTAFADSESGKINWIPGDAISIFYNKVGSKFTSTLTEAAPISNFTGSLEIMTGFGEESDAAYTLWGVYPYKASSSSDGSSVTIAHPSEQIAVDGSFDPEAYITVGKTDTRAMAFYAVCGGIKFTVGASDIKSIAFISNNDEALSGTVSVNFGEDNLPAITKTKNPLNSVKLYAPKKETFASGVQYYAVTLPCELTGGFTAIFYKNGKVGKKEFNSPVTIKRKTFGVLENIDADVVYEDLSWDEVMSISTTVNKVEAEINPVTKEPVIAVMDKPAASADGNIFIYNGIGSAAVAIPQEITSKELALGVSDSGAGYIFTLAKSSPYTGYIFSSDDMVSWTKADVSIDRSNSYYGRTIGCLGNEAFMMTCNNAAGAVGKRAINTTKFNGTSWTSGLGDLVSTTYTQRYYPVLRKWNGKLYCSVLNVGKGFSIYSYDGTSWTNALDLDFASDSPYYGVQLHNYQDVAIDPDGYIWTALGVKSGTSYSIYAVRLSTDPADAADPILQIGDPIALTSSISARYARIAISPTGETYLAYRDDNQHLNVCKLNDEYEWDPAQKLTTSAVDDVRILNNADGDFFIVCSVSGVSVKVFKLIK